MVGVERGDDEARQRGEREGGSGRKTQTKGWEKKVKEE